MIVIKKIFIFSLLIILGILFSLNLINTNFYAEKENHKFVIYIDPGHGGFDGGCLNDDQTIIEKNITLDFSLRLKKYLTSSGYIVKLTRETDIALGNTKKEDIYKRVNLINNSNADIYISIHANSYPSPNIKGAQVFYNNQNENNKILSEILTNKINEMDDENKRKAQNIKNKYLLDHANTIGCLIELGFLTNKFDVYKLTNNEYLNDFVLTIYLGILEYFEYLK